MLSCTFKLRKKVISETLTKNPIQINTQDECDCTWLRDPGVMFSGEQLKKKLIGNMISFWEASFSKLVTCLLCSPKYSGG
jgi:hypothetical protein